MIIYNKTWLANLRLQGEVKKELDRGNISADEFEAIQQQYPVGFYTPNVFVRAGLIIVTCIIVLFADGLLSMMAASSSIVTTWGWVMFLGLLTYAAFETMLHNTPHYRSGVDDALAFIAGGQIAGAFVMMFSGQQDIALPLCLIVLVIGICLTLRTADMLMAAITCGAFLGSVFFLWIRIMPAGLATAPFGMMVVAGIIYWLGHKYAQVQRYINYTDCLLVAEIVGLIVFYAAGNYYVIQNLSTEMAHRQGPVPFGWFFWVWTVALPFAYIWIGIDRKDAILLRIGLLLIAAASATVRYYVHLMPPEIMLTLAGAVLLAIALCVTRYLKTPKHGLTTAEPEEINTLDRLKVGSLIVAESFGHSSTPPAQPDKGVEFGGGSFGGGGSSGSF